jgi:hypothetical protein
MFPTKAARTGSSIPFSDPCVVKIFPATAGNPLVEQSYDPFVAGKNRLF